MSEFSHPVTYAELAAVSDQTEVFGGPGFLPEELACALTALANTMDTRKQAWQFTYPLPASPDLPDAIANAARWADDYKVPNNTAILKRYRLDDVYRSAAYDLHSDPAAYDQHRIALLTASGCADLLIKLRNGHETSIPCGERTAVFAAPGVIHAVTPPSNPSGVRDFLFLGYDHTLEPSGIDSTREVLPKLELMSCVLAKSFAEK